ncbi:MAG: PPOX class probable FMN-dependent enzyme [Halioglobus sp.]|jgi:PPOX class probable FMN-dependent enzyme
MEDNQVTTNEELAKIIGSPSDMVKQKISSELDEQMVTFIGRSSLVFISTIDRQGNPDISPKGDPAGFVKVSDNANICIPDRPGNKLLFSFHNLIANPSIGLIFVIPNYRETLRIKGKAILSKDPQLLSSMSVKGKPALLVTKIAVEECFFHCGKAMIRSKTWNPDSWEKHGKSLIAEQVANKFNGGEELSSLVEAELEKNYIEELY